MGSDLRLGRGRCRREPSRRPRDGSLRHRVFGSPGQIPRIRSPVVPLKLEAVPWYTWGGTRLGIASGLGTLHPSCYCRRWGLDPPRRRLRAVSRQGKASRVSGRLHMHRTTRVVVIEAEILFFGELSCI